MSKEKKTSVYLLIGKIALTVLACMLIIQTVDVIASLKIIAEAAPFGVIAALALLLAQVVANGLRWGVLARSNAIPLTAADAVRRFWESLFFGQFTPSGVGGDAWRIYSVGKISPALANAANSVILDRVIGAASLFSIVVCGFLITILIGQVIDRSAVLAAGIVAFGICAGIFLLVFLRKIPGRFLSWDRFGIGDLMQRTSHQLERSLAQPQPLAVGMTLSVFGHLSCAVAVWFLARSVGFAPGILACFIIVPLAVLISMLPITIAGWGLREGVVAAGFVKAGADLETAAAISLMFGLSLMILGLCGGVLLWLSKKAPPSSQQPTLEVLPPT